MARPSVASGSMVLEPIVMLTVDCRTGIAGSHEDRVQNLPPMKAEATKIELEQPAASRYSFRNTKHFR